MKLLIVSHMPHYRRDGRIVGWGPTAQELDHLARLFDEVRHIACLHEEPAPLSSLPYQANNISLIPVPPSGGVRLRDKLKILRLAPLYLRTIRRELEWADMVHVRCPANISLLALVLLKLSKRPRPRWFKYAGNWRPRDSEAWSYTLQRWWLEKNLSRGSVTVNGQWPNQPPHVHSFLNPCLTATELAEARERAAEKHLTLPMRLLFVGRLEAAKGVGRAINILNALRQKRFSVSLDLIGDGPERPSFERLVEELDLTEHVTFHGWLARTQLAPFLTRAHVMLFPASSSEGWPKVLSEGMAYGVVPVASDVSSIPQYLENIRAGHALAPDNTNGFADAIIRYYEHPEIWKEESQRGVQAAGLFSYDSYLAAVQLMFKSIHLDETETGLPDDLTSSGSSSPA